MSGSRRVQVIPDIRIYVTKSGAALEAIREEATTLVKKGHLNSGDVLRDTETIGGSCPAQAGHVVL